MRGSVVVEDSDDGQPGGSSGWLLVSVSLLKVSRAVIVANDCVDQIQVKR